jgi:hypothetical protein
MQVVYSKGANLDCPDALSPLAYEVSANAARPKEWAAALGIPPETDELEVSEAFVVTRSAAKQVAPHTATVDVPAASGTPEQVSTFTTEVEAQGTLKSPEQGAPPSTGLASATASAPDNALPTNESEQCGLTLVTTAEIRKELCQTVSSSQRFSATQTKL